MKTTSLFSITLLLLFLQGSRICHAQDASVNKNEISKLSALEGKWYGTGWYQMGNQPKHQIKQTEHVYTKLDGQLMVIDGQGKDSETDEIVFEAFAVINYVPQKNEYQFSAYTNEGRYTQASAKFEGDDLVWWFETPQGTIKYKIDFTEDTWVEDGHFSPDGEKWYPFFHMELKKLQ